MLGSEISPQLNSNMEKEATSDLEKEVIDSENDDNDNDDDTDDTDENEDLRPDTDSSTDSSTDPETDSELEVNKGQTINKINKTNNLKLAQMFKENMNKLTLEKSELADLEKNVKTKTDTKHFLNAIELLNRKELNDSFDKNYKYLYPHLDDEYFNIKIANKEEFAENKLHINLDSDFEKLSNEICNKGDWIINCRI